jgi:predicted DNA-binding protein (UPF0251 family)
MTQNPVSPLDPRVGEVGRFASALAGFSGAWAVDALTASAIAAADAGREAAGLSQRERLYRELIRLNRRRALAAPVERDDDTPMRRAEDFARRVERLPLEEKEALLLVALARFAYAEGARVLDISPDSFADRVMRARARLDCGVPVAPLRHPSYLRVVK